MLSNSGVVPLRDDYGAFRAVDFFSASSAPMLSADVSLFCNTFDGRLRVNLVFSEGVLARSEARQIADALKLMLVDEMCADRAEIEPDETSAVHRVAG